MITNGDSVINSLSTENDDHTILRKDYTYHCNCERDTQIDLRTIVHMTLTTRCVDFIRDSFVYLFTICKRAVTSYEIWLKIFNANSVILFHFWGIKPYYTDHIFPEEGQCKAVKNFS